MASQMRFMAKPRILTIRQYAKRFEGFQLYFSFLCLIYLLSFLSCIFSAFLVGGLSLAIVYSGILVSGIPLYCYLNCIQCIRVSWLIKHFVGGLSTITENLR